MDEHSTGAASNDSFHYDLILINMTKANNKLAEPKERPRNCLVSPIKREKKLVII